MERLQTMMTQAVDDGRIITVEAKDRLAVPEAESRRVYKREHCYDCGTPVVTGTIKRAHDVRLPAVPAGVDGLSRRCRPSRRTATSRHRCAFWITSVSASNGSRSSRSCVR